MRIFINEKEYAAEPGEFVLAVARRNRVIIPTLCHHEGLPGQGCCRICLVEVRESGREKIVTSCVYPVSDGLTVFTDTEKVARLRRKNLAFLRDRAPGAERIRQLCRLYQVPTPGDVPANAERCILCGLCAHACHSLGAGAISTVNRGVSKKIAPPYEEAPESCIGCGSCAAACPTAAIPMEETAATREIWGRTFTFLRCLKCGEAFDTAESAAYAANKAGIGEETGLCPHCRARAIGAVLKGVYGREQ